jgi:hypothetical protein
MTETFEKQYLKVYRTRGPLQTIIGDLIFENQQAFPALFVIATRSHSIFVKRAIRKEIDIFLSHPPTTTTFEDGE